MRNKNSIELDVLALWVMCDLEAGKLYWKKSPNYRAPAGSEAGNITNGGYRTFQLNLVKIQVHRAIFALHHGFWPLLEIDHINGNRLDNRISNLRQLTGGQNKQNSIVARKRNASGLIGASWHSSRNKWRSSIQVNGKATHLGYFNTADDAHACYLKAKAVMHPSWAGLPKPMALRDGELDALRELGGVPA